MRKLIFSAEAVEAVHSRVNSYSGIQPFQCATCKSHRYIEKSEAKHLARKLRLDTAYRRDSERRTGLGAPTVPLKASQPNELSTNGADLLRYQAVHFLYVLPASPYEGQIRRRSQPPRRRKEMETEWYGVDDVYSGRLEGIQVGGLAGC